MARGRFTGTGPSGAGRSNDALRRLSELGSTSTRSSKRDPGAVANEHALMALGERIDGRREDAPAPRIFRRRGQRRPRRRWSRRRRVLTALGLVIVLLAGIAGAGYFYLQYEWGKVKKIDCTSCAVVTGSMTPFNVLLIGSDTRAGDTGQAARSFGTAASNGGQHSDTIKILHIDPPSGTAQLLSIPRDTWVNVSGLPQSSGLNGPEKINAAFNNASDPTLGPNSLIQTIQNTFGIPISHFVEVDFLGLINAVGSIGGINMNVPFPVRDCSAQGCSIDNSGLQITTTGCQTLNGNQTLALARSRYFQYYDPAQGGWLSDPTSDIGRIERQNLIIEALVKKIESTYNPFTLRAFISSVVNDVAVDQQLSPGLLFSLANHYHAFSTSRLQTFTLPTAPATNSGGDVEIVQEPQAQELITRFLGAAPSALSTPPLDANNLPLAVPDLNQGSTASSGAAVSSTGAAHPSPPSTTVPPYDPVPC